MIRGTKILVLTQKDVKKSIFGFSILNIERDYKNATPQHFDVKYSEFYQAHYILCEIDKDKYWFLKNRSGRRKILDLTEDPLLDWFNSRKYLERGATNRVEFLFYWKVKNTDCWVRVDILRKKIRFSKYKIGNFVSLSEFLDGAPRDAAIPILYDLDFYQEFNLSD